MFLKVIIFIAVFYLIYRTGKSWLLKNIPQPDESIDSGKVSEVDDVMIKDPYCEIYFPKRKGIYKKIGGEDFYFCSSDCRDKYLELAHK